MNQQTRANSVERWIIRSLMVMLVFQIGCAQFRVPAIDPSGNSIFLPAPNRTQFLTPGAAAGPANPLFQPAPFSQPASAPAPQYPIQPAFQNPPQPPPCYGPAAAQTVKKNLVPDVTGHKSPGQNGQIIMTPSRIVAPVGSEVVVLAGICGNDGYFVKNQPLEWMMPNNSVGEFVEIGGMQHSNFNKLIPPTTKKFNGQYAWGRTGLKRVTLSRGTPTAVDDIDLAQGQTFVSVSSSSPGTSYITAVAPKAEGWDKRRASTVIHWVDGQWAIPIPSRATAGTVHPLTTVVSRSADGGGVKGWDVRYAIVGGAPAEFAPTGSQTADSTTNNEGQATVQIRQPAGQFSPGTTQVRVDIVRPPIFGESELVVESGITTVTWSAPELTLRAVGPRQAEFDRPFNFRVEVANPGDQLARDVVVRTKNLDDAIEFISSTPKPTEYGRQYEWRLGDIASGSPARLIDIQFKSKKRGNVDMCFEVVSAIDNLQTEVCTPTEIVLPSIGLKIDGPTNARIGDNVTFNITVENQSNQPLEGLQALVSFDTGLARPGRNPLPFNNELMLQVGESQSIPPLTFNVQAPGPQCLTVQVSAKGVPTQTDRICVNVEGTAVAGPGTDVGDGSPGDSPLLIQVTGGPPVEVGKTTRIEAQITNRGRVPLDRVTLINRFSASLEPTGLSENFAWEMNGDELWVTVGQIPPGQLVTVEIEYTGQQIDPDGGTQLTVSTPSGANAVGSRAIPVAAAGSGVGGGAGPGPGASGNGMQPDFNDLANGDGIAIPGDTAVPNDLSIKITNLDPTIRVGQRARITFNVTNNRATPIEWVDVSLVVPNSLRVSIESTPTNLRLIRQYEFQRALTLRAGESLVWNVWAEAMAPGEAIFEVEAQSKDTVGVSRSNIAINVVQ